MAHYTGMDLILLPKALHEQRRLSTDFSETKLVLKMKVYKMALDAHPSSAGEKAKPE